MGRKNYNSLNDIKINQLEIGMCPICSRRLTSECEHRTAESEMWYAAQIIAEQELYSEQSATLNERVNLATMQATDAADLSQAKSVWQKFAEDRDRNFNRHYYGNSNGDAEFV